MDTRLLASSPLRAVPALIVLVGASGAGKSTFARTHFAADQILSSDGCREQVCGNPNDQDATPAAFALLNELLDVRLAAGLTTVIDATNTAPGTRVDYAARAAKRGLRPVAIILRTPLDACLARQRTRPEPPPGQRWGRRVSDDVVRDQYAAAQAASGVRLSAEGFLDVHVLTPDPATGAWPVELLRPYLPSRVDQPR